MPGPALSERDLAVLRSFARRIDPSDAGAHNNLGVLYYQKGLIGEAIAAVRPRARARSADAGGAGQPRDRLPRERLLRPPHRRAAGARCAARPTTARPAGSWAAPTPRSGRHDRGDRGVRGAARPAPRRRPGACSSSGLAEKARGNLDAATDWLRAAPASSIPAARSRGSTTARCSTTAASTSRRSTRSREAIARNPDYAEAHYLLAFVYGDLGQHERARDATKRAIALNPDARARAGQSRARALRAGRTAPARRCTGAPRGRQIVEGGALAHYNLGLAFRQKGYYDEALREYRLALEAGEDRRLGAAGDGRGAPAAPRAGGGARALRRAGARDPPTRRSSGTSAASACTRPAGATRRSPPTSSAVARRSAATQLAWNNLGVLRAGDAGPTPAIDGVPRGARAASRPLARRAAQPRRCCCLQRRQLQAALEEYREVLAEQTGERRRLERRRPRADGAQALRGCAQRLRPRGGRRPGHRRRRTTT